MSTKTEEIKVKTTTVPLSQINSNTVLVKDEKIEKTTVISSTDTKTDGTAIKEHLKGWPFWIFIIITIVVLVITIMLGKGQSAWYADLKKSSWAENIVVWAVLYGAVIIIMSWCSSFAYCLADYNGKMYILSSFIISMILLIITFYVFFTAKNLDVAFYLTLILLAVSIFQTFVVWQCHAGSGIGMLPYVVFLIFAAGITYDISSKNTV
jgi:tryptophan-rich sensory protein